jgi:site-specific recombinase XerD
MKNDKNKLFFSLVSEFLNIYLLDQLGRSKKTIKSYKDALTLFRRYINEDLQSSIGKFEFIDCDRDCILNFMEYLKRKGDIDKTRNHHLAVMKSYMKFATIKDISLQSYALEVINVQFCKEVETIPPMLTEAGITAILRQPVNNKKGIRNKTLMILLFDTATRIDEVLSLVLENIHLTKDNPYIKVLGKGAKERILSLSDGCVKHLELYLSIYHNSDSPNTNLLFYTIIHDNVNKMSESTVERFIQIYADIARMEVPEIPKHTYCHLFRSYRATQLYQDGVPLDVVSRLLGHENLETTRLYAKPSKEALKKAINSIEPKTKMSQIKKWKNKEDKLAHFYGIR